jgi:hypothetical protein
MALESWLSKLEKPRGSRVIWEKPAAEIPDEATGS